MTKPLVIATTIIGVCFLSYPALLSGQQNNIRVYAHSSVSDLYSYRLNGEYQRYLVGNTNSLGFSQGRGGDSLSVEFRQGAWKGRYSHLHEAGEKLELHYPLSRLRLALSKKISDTLLHASIGMGEVMEFETRIHNENNHRLRMASLGIVRKRADISYRVGNEAGKIPFEWIALDGKLEARLWHTPLKLHMTSILPSTSDSLFANKISAWIGSTEFSHQLSEHLTASLEAGGTVFRAKLYYKDEVYGKLDNLRMGMIRASLDKSAHCLDTGISITAAIGGSDDDSYLDIWPFSFWDAFLASRTRIKKMDFHVLSPEALVRIHWGRNKKTGWKGSAGITYNHIFHHENVIHKNRVMIIYPFFFGYETFQYDWHNELDACLRVPLHLAYHLRQGSIFLDAQQTAPFKWSKLIKSAETPVTPVPDEPRGTTWGGLTVTLGCSFIF